MIPEDVMNDFVELERRLKESNGERDPYAILWEYAREKSKPRTNGTGEVHGAIISGEPTSEGDGQPEQRESIQVGTSESSISDIGEPKQSEPDNSPSTPTTGSFQQLKALFSKKK